MDQSFRTLISVEDLSKLVFGAEPRKSLVVVDCRFTLTDTSAGERAYEAGHIPGAVYAHLERDLSGAILQGVTGRHPLPEREALAGRLGSWGLDPAKQLVAYDDSVGSMAARLWWLARWLGHERVAVLDGGYPAWVAAGQPVTAERSAVEPRTFIPSAPREWTVTAADVAAARTDPTRRVFDARARERYRGDVEPIDPVGGHIPGAVCLPFSDNVIHGRFQPPGELRQRFERALEGVPPTNAIVYCGSGVTACHHLLALAHAGLEGARLYPGSWSEWINDPRRPVARGEESE